VVEARDLTVSYAATGERPAVEGVSFSLCAGEKLALIGANGAGKSTLLLVLAGALLPLKGSLVVDGVPVQKDTLKRLRQKAGLVFQNPEDQFFMPTVEDDICFGPRNYGVDEGVIQGRLETVLKTLGIEGLRKRSAHQLSGGEKRLAALAGILIMEPPLLLLDEPTSFLDPRSRRNLLGILGGLGQAMIAATHDLDMARRLCSRAVILKEGRVAACGAVGDILDDDVLLEACGL
jgi:cobalt/nickel transport system ATP-binding protein